MTDEVRKQIDGLETFDKHKIVQNTPTFNQSVYVLKSDVIELVDSLIKWNKVEDCLPELGQKVLVRCGTGNVTISSRYAFGYKEYWKGSGTFTASIIEWKPII